MSIDISPAQAKRNVAILVLAQAVLGAQMPILFILGGLAGLSLASNPCFATLPISMIILGSVIAATPLSAFMQKYGRRAGFMLGAGFGATGAAISAYGLYIQSFEVFIAGSLFTGVYMSGHGFYRFAAADTSEAEFRPKAISYVLAGGLAAAIIGPQLVKLTSEAMVIPFLGAYLAVIVINLVGSLMFLFLDIPTPPPPSEDEPAGRSRMELLKTPVIAVAIICAMVSYALMNLAMTSTPLAVVGCGFDQNAAADIVSMHVLAMYIPSFFTGHLIARFGPVKIISLGLIILGAAGATAMTGVELENFFVSLVLLGVGWNFGYIGATSMLAASYEPSERGRIQGMNDMLVFGGVVVASLASGGLMNCSGGDAQEGWQAVNLAMIPFLALAGAALIWLVMRPERSYD
ncbi:MFS transporter [Profundibacter sp.]